MNTQSDNLFGVERHSLGFFADVNMDCHLPIERELFEVGFKQQIVFGGGHLERVQCLCEVMNIGGTCDSTGGQG